MSSRGSEATEGSLLADQGSLAPLGMTTLRLFRRLPPSGQRGHPRGFRGTRSLPTRGKAIIPARWSARFLARTIGRGDEAVRLHLFERTIEGGGTEQPLLGRI